MERTRIQISLDETGGPIQWAVTRYNDLHDYEEIHVHPMGPFDTPHEAWVEALVYADSRWGEQLNLPF